MRSACGQLCFILALPGALAAAAMLCGCQSAPRNLDAVYAYYEYDFTSAREALRRDADVRNDEQVVLNNLRLGVAALADGDLYEAERALDRTFEWLSTAGLNEDRTTAAVLTHEGVRIWKGEPFEQALAYHYVATLYAVMDDWENARAAAANALFRLTDFGGDQTPEQLVRQAAEDEDYLERRYTAVDTDFALGLLMEAIGSDVSGAAGSKGQFDAALEINGDLAPLVGTLRRREYDTLLIVDYGKGPTKQAYGPDDALVRFAAQEPGGARLVVSVDGREAARAAPVCDVVDMARDHRWNNLEDIRRAKSAIGQAMIIGGLGVASSSSKDEHRLAGLGMMLAGMLTRSGAKADTRYFEFAPQSIYLVPLRLGEPRGVQVMVEGDDGSRMALPEVEPGKAGDEVRPAKPRAVYVRLHGRDSPSPSWLRGRDERYGNDRTGVRNGDYPWILGGRDLSTPSRKTLEAYQANGYLTDCTLNDLLRLYEAEGIHPGTGKAGSNERINPSYRHVLEGGTALFTPEPNSMGYKRLMFTEHEPYRPKSDLVRNAAERIRVQQEEQQRGASR